MLLLLLLPVVTAGGGNTGELMDGVDAAGDGCVEDEAIRALQASAESGGVSNAAVGSVPRGGVTGSSLTAGNVRRGGLRG